MNEVKEQELRSDVWLRDGDLVYMLEGTGHYRKGKEQLRNKCSLRAEAFPGAAPEVRVALAEKVLNLLQRDSATPTGAELFAALHEAQLRLMGWVETTYPIGAVVEFSSYTALPLKGEVCAYGFSLNGDPGVKIKSAHDYHLINPFTTSINVLYRRH
jgi:hypothetical protein